MRAFLFSLLAAVAVIMLWAIRSESYQNGVVFTLSTLAAGLCGYLLADYFFNIEKKTLKQDVIGAGREVQALKDEKDLLQTQFNLATPHSQVQQLEQQLSFADEQRNKLDGLTRAQYAEISGLKTQLEMQKKNYQKLYEDAAVVTETHNSEITNLQDTLASKRDKIKYLTDEGDYLRNKILKLQTVAEEETIQKVVTEVNQPPASQLPKMVVKMPQNGTYTEGSPLQMIDPRSIKFDTVDAESTVETAVEEPINNPVEVEVFIENKDIAQSNLVENKPSETEAALEKKTVGIPLPLGNQSFVTPDALVTDAINTPREIEAEPTTDAADASNLQAIEGISAEMERVLKSAGIDNWQEISETTPERLQEILLEGKIRDVDVSHWSVQAILLADGHLSRLKTYLENLKK